MLIVGVRSVEEVIAEKGRLLMKLEMIRMPERVVLSSIVATCVNLNNARALLAFDTAAPDEAALEGARMFFFINKTRYVAFLHANFTARIVSATTAQLRTRVRATTGDVAFSAGGAHRTGIVVVFAIVGRRLRED